MRERDNRERECSHASVNTNPNPKTALKKKKIDPNPGLGPDTDPAFYWRFTLVTVLDLKEQLKRMSLHELNFNK